GSFPAAGLERLRIEPRRQAASAGAGEVALVDSIRDAGRLPGAACAAGVDAKDGEMALLAPDPGIPACRVVTACRALAQRVEVLECSGLVEAEPALAVAEQQEVRRGRRGEQLDAEVVLALAADEAQRLDLAHLGVLPVHQAGDARRFAGREREEPASLAGGHLGDDDRAVAAIL